MRRLFIIVGLVLAVVGLMATSVEASSPHFIKASASGPNNSGDLSVSFKIAGLGDAVTTTVVASADANALYACRNNGKNFPSDPKKQEESGLVTASGDFTSGKNGSVSGTLTLHPPASSLSCPPGQQRVLVSVTYSDVAVSQTDTGTEGIPGTFSRVFFTI